MSDLIVRRAQGLYCPPGDFYIDPMPRQRDGGVRVAVVTHGHGDHARSGADHYLCSPESESVLLTRLGRSTPVEALDYGVRLQIGPVAVSLHPAGHVLGSAQVRVEHAGRVWVVSGDYKRDPDPTCRAFEVVPCQTFVTEATFALPIYRWRPTAEVALDIHAWWRRNAECGRPSVLFCYAFGKAQRVLAELARLQVPEQPQVLLHGAMHPLTAVYRQAGVPMLPTRRVSDLPPNADVSRSLVLAPPSAAGTPWMRRFRGHSTGFASGWMRVRGNRRRRGYDRGFVISDHADWPSLIRTIRDTGAERVIAHHGQTDVLIRYLRESGVAADRFAGDAP